MSQPAVLRGETAPVQRLAAWCISHGWTLAVWGAMTAWSIVLFEHVRAGHAEFATSRFDLGNMTQAVWSTVQGRPLEMTDGLTGEQISRLAYHVDPILALLTPAWLVAPSPLTLAGIQVLAIAAGALPVYWLGRKHLGSEPAAALVAFAYLAYPWVAWSAIDAMHPVALAIPLVLFGIWFLDEDRLLAFAAVAVLALLCGELVGLTIGGLGLWYAIARGRRIPGLAIAAVGLGWTLVAVLFVVPHYAGDHSPYYSYFDSVGGSPSGLARTALTDPIAVVAALSDRHDLLYPILLAVPLLGMFVLSPLLASVALPQILVNALAERPTTTDPRQHYASLVMAVLVAATVLGLARLDQKRRMRAAVAVLGAAIACSALLGPVPGVGSQDDRRPVYSAPHLQALRDAVALVPDGVPVTSTNLVGAHLSARERFYSVPIVGRAEWAVVDTWNPWIPSIGRLEDLDPDALRAMTLRLDRSSEWTKVFDRNGVLVYRKAAR